MLKIEERVRAKLREGLKDDLPQLETRPGWASGTLPRHDDPSDERLACLLWEGAEPYAGAQQRAPSALWAVDLHATVAPQDIVPCGIERDAMRHTFSQRGEAATATALLLQTTAAVLGASYGGCFYSYALSLVRGCIHAQVKTLPSLGLLPWVKADGNALAVQASDMLSMLGSVATMIWRGVTGTDADKTRMHRLLSPTDGMGRCMRVLRDILTEAAHKGSASPLRAWRQAYDSDPDDLADPLTVFVTACCAQWDAPVLANGVLTFDHVPRGSSVPRAFALQVIESIRMLCARYADVVTQRPKAHKEIALLRSAPAHAQSCLIDVVNDVALLMQAAPGIISKYDRTVPPSTPVASTSFLGEYDTNRHTLLIPNTNAAFAEAFRCFADAIEPAFWGGVSPLSAAIAGARARQVMPFFDDIVAFDVWPLPEAFSNTDPTPSVSLDMHDLATADPFEELPF